MPKIQAPSFQSSRASPAGASVDLTSPLAGLPVERPSASTAKLSPSIPRPLFTTAAAQGDQSNFLPCQEQATHLRRHTTKHALCQAGSLFHLGGPRVQASSAVHGLLEPWGCVEGGSAMGGYFGSASDRSRSWVRRAKKGCVRPAGDVLASELDQTSVLFGLRLTVGGLVGLGTCGCTAQNAQAISWRA